MFVGIVSDAKEWREKNLYVYIRIKCMYIRIIPHLQGFEAVFKAFLSPKNRFDLKTIANAVVMTKELG